MPNSFWNNLLLLSLLFVVGKLKLSSYFIGRPAGSLTVLHVYQQIKVLAGESKLLTLRHLELLIDWSDEKQSILLQLYFLTESS